VLTAVEAVCNDEFNMHGLLATTMPVGPVLVCSGPGTRMIGMNSGVNALGQGNRANATIGRALQLVVRNVGGGRPGEVDRATHGNPGKLSFCFAEADDESPFGTLAGHSRRFPRARRRAHRVRRRGARASSTSSRATPESLAGSLAAACARCTTPSWCWRSTRSSSQPRARPGLRRRRLGPRPPAVRAPHAPHHTRPRARARRRRHRRGHPGRASPPADLPKFRPTG
jgi:hypothetical protein